MPSSFLYTDESKGVSIFLSRAVIKRDLASLRGSVNETAETSEPQNSEDAELLSVFNKLSFAPKVVTSLDIEALISQLEIREGEDELEFEQILPFLFTMNKSHFKAMIYLLSENLISYDEINEIKRANFYTRTDLLFRKFEFGDSETILLLDNLINGSTSPLNRSLKTPSSSVMTPEPTYPDISVDSTPEEYYAVRNVLPSKDRFKNSVKWESQNGEDITQETKNKSLNSLEQADWYYANIAIFQLFPTLPFLIIIAITIAATGVGAVIALIAVAALIGWKTIDSLDRYRRGGILGSSYDSYLQYLKENTKYELPKRQIKKSDSLNHILNHYLPDYARRTLLSPRFFPDDLFRTTAARAGASMAISDSDKKPFDASIFHHLYFTINNTGNYKTLSSFDYADFNTNASNAFRSAITSAGTDVFDLSYIDDGNAALTPLKERLLRIFPEFGTSRSDSNYIRKLMTSSVSEDGQKDRSWFSRDESVRNSARTFTNFGLLVDQSNLAVLNIGNSGKAKEYAQEALRLAMIKLEAAAGEAGSTIQINPIGYGTYEDAQEGIADSRDLLVEEILAQTSNPSDISTSRYNKFLTDENNVLFKPILADMVTSYMDYLVDTNLSSPFSFFVAESSNTNKIYKALNFAKHIFSLSFNSFVTRIGENSFQREFDLLMLTIKASLRRNKFFDILDDGITEKEISDLFSLNSPSNNGGN